MPGWVLSVLASDADPARAGGLRRRLRPRPPARRAASSPWLAWLAAGGGAVRDRARAGLRAGAHRRDARSARGAGGPGRVPARRGRGRGAGGGRSVDGGAGWAALRFLVVRADPELADRPRPARPCVVALVLSVAVAGAVAGQPVRGAAADPALHLWMLATLIDPPPPRRARIAMVAGGPAASRRCWRCTSSSRSASTR